MVNIGAQTTADTVNADFVRMCQNLAATCGEIIAFAKYVDGQAANNYAGLMQLGFDTPTAQAFQGAVDISKTIALVFQGQATQPGNYDFSNALAEFIGPSPAVQAG